MAGRKRADPRAYGESLARSGGSGPWVVELLCERVASPPRAELLARLRARAGDVAPLERDEASLFFAFRDRVTEFEDGAAPAQLLVFDPVPSVDAGALEPALAQARHWPEAREVVRACQATLAVSDLMASTLEPAERLRLLHEGVRSVAELVPCRAIHWLPAQKLLGVEDYLRAVETRDHLFPAVNVRLLDGLADTVGLAAFGLPDAQLRLDGKDATAASRLLYGVAASWFERAEAVEDGQSIDDVEGGAKLRCRRARAAFPPERDVFVLEAERV